MIVISRIEAFYYPLDVMLNGAQERDASPRAFFFGILHFVQDGNIQDWQRSGYQFIGKITQSEPNYIS
jgi:hypothetical protein